MILIYKHFPSSIYLSVLPSILVSSRPSLCPSIHPCVHPSIHPCVHPSILPCVLKWKPSVFVQLKMDWRLQSGALADPLFFFFLFIIFISLGGHPLPPSPPDKRLPLVFSVANGRGRDCCSFFTCTEAHCLILKLSCLTC